MLFQGNQFFLPFLAAALLLGFRLGVQRFPGICISFRRWIVGRRLTALMVITGVLGALFAAVEAYYYMGACKVSERYQAGVVDLMRTTLRVAASPEVGVVLWADFATLLCVVRNEPIIAWDQDCDFSAMFEGHLKLKRFRDALHEAGVATEYYDDRCVRACARPRSAVAAQCRCVASCFRSSLTPPPAPPPPPPRARACSMLLQMYQPGTAARNAPHMDVWFWTPQEFGRTKYLYSNDRTCHVTLRAQDDMFPLRPGKLMGVDVLIPHDSRRISELEYGPTYNVSMYNRKDCFHNLMQLRWAY